VLDTVIVPINRAGWPFIVIAFVVAVALGFLWPPLFWLGFLATAFCVYFFRDPPRVTPTREGLIVSPADGRLEMIEQAVPPPELDMGDTPLMRVSVFLNIFDVHVNRVPLGGVVTAVSYRPGKFLNAALDKASEENERMSVRLESDDGRQIAFVQIAGLVARRIKCDLKQGDSVATGQVFGLIRFGSRMDVYLPEGVQPLVALGQSMVAGETVIADLQGQEPQRMGEKR
jgi:phosphatidylserine decarboxylase